MVNFGQVMKTETHRKAETLAITNLEIDCN